MSSYLTENFCQSLLENYHPRGTGRRRATASVHAIPAAAAAGFSSNVTLSVTQR